MKRSYLCGGQHRVFIQAEDGVGHDGLVGQEAAAHHLRREKKTPHQPRSFLIIWSTGSGPRCPLIKTPSKSFKSLLLLFLVNKQCGVYLF